jgi:hypothetical protein
MLASCTVAVVARKPEIDCDDDRGSGSIIDRLALTRVTISL